MLKINSKKDRPNFDFVKQEVDKLLQENGIRFLPEIEREHKNIVIELSNTKKTIEDCYGIENIASPKKIQDFLLSLGNSEIETLIYDYKKKKYTTDKEAMQKLAENGFAVGEDILTFREIDSRRKHFSQLLNFMDKDFTVRPITVYSETNRLMYKDPGLMSINKNIIKKYLSPLKENEMILSVDVSSQEPKIVANMLGIANIATMDNLYESIAEKALGLTAITEEQRNQIKSAHNAIAYGGGEKEIIRICKDLDGKRLYGFYKQVPEFKEYKKKCEYFARKGVKTTFTLFDTEIVSTGHNYLVGTLMNAPMQGTASDINCLLIENFLRNKPNGMELYFPRVDEAIIRVQKDIVNYEEILTDLFEHQVDSWAPFKVKIKVIR